MNAKPSPPDHPGAARELLRQLPFPAAYAEGDSVNPNAHLLDLTGYIAEDFTHRDAWLDLFFRERAAAVYSEHERDRATGFPAPRMCKLYHRQGEMLAVQWASSALGAGELWIFHPVRALDELPFSTYGMTEESVGDMLYWVEEDASIRSVNRVACETLGYTPEEMLTKTIRDIAPDYTPEGWAKMWHQLRHKKRIRLDGQHRKRSGDIIHIEIMAQHSVIAGSEYACATVRDITARKRHAAELEQELRDREHLLATLAGMAYRCTLDDVGRIVYASDGALDLCGYAATEILQQALSFKALVHPDDQGLVAAQRGTGIQQRRPFSCEYRIRCADGSVRWVLDLAQSIYDADGVPTAIQGFLMNITARKHAEEAMIESQMLFIGFMDHTPMIAYIKDEDGRLLYVNNSFIAAIWQNAPPAWQGKLDHELWNEADAAQFRRNDLRVLEKNAAIQFEEELHTPSGVEHWIASKFPLDAPNGRRLVAGLASNVTEQRAALENKRRMEENMLHMQKLESMGVLAGGIAHDFNNLLTSIMGYADLAALEIGTESSATHSVSQIHKAAQRAAELTRQMLAYSGRGRFIVQPLDLAELVREMGSLLALGVSKRCHLHYDLPENIAAIEGDASQLRQIVMNLIINASEAIGDIDGTVRISVGTQWCSREVLRAAYLDENLPEGDYTFVEVADTGCGMDDETQSRLFDPFFTTKFAGRGLGMAATLGIVRGHRGAITVRSAPGQGTDFRVYFPVSWRKPQGGTVPAPTAPARYSGTILVADDEPTVRELAGEMLRTVGFHVLLAADGREAVEMYTKNRKRICGVLLDATMPNLDGPETLRELRRLNPALPVVLSSGYSEYDINAKCGEEQPNGFIEKPYTATALLEIFAEILPSDSRKA